MPATRTAAPAVGRLNRELADRTTVSNAENVTPGEYGTDVPSTVTDPNQTSTAPGTCDPHEIPRVWLGEHGWQCPTCAPDLFEGESLDDATVDPDPIPDPYDKLDTSGDRGGVDPAFQYPGSKAAMAEDICRLLNIDKNAKSSGSPVPGCFIEVFGGSAAVLLHSEKRPSAEVYNDLNDLVYTFFKVCREQPRELYHALYWTPYSQVEFTAADYNEPGISELERVRRWLVCTNQTMVGASSSHTGKFIKTIKDAGQSNATKWRRYKNRIRQIADRFQEVQLTKLPALELIAQAVKNNDPSTALYIDPPYITTTREISYAVDMADEDHDTMIDLILDYAGPIVVSGYDHPIYRRLDDAPGWHRVEVETRNAKQSARTEILWTNRLPRGQESMF